MLIAGLAALPRRRHRRLRTHLLGPPRITADTGVDSFTHALEAYVSRRANAVSDALAMSAMRLIGANLRTAYREPRNAEARDAMMLGATRQASPSATLRSPWCTACPGRSARISTCRTASPTPCCCPPSPASRSAPPCRATPQAARLSASPAPGDADQLAGAKLLEGLAALNAELGVPTPALRHLGCRLGGKKALMAEQALASGSPGNNPRMPEAAEIIALYESMYPE